MLKMRLCHLVSLFLLEIGSVLSSPATHVYPADCAPPDSAVATTTPTPDPNSTLPFFYHGVLPIEYCCPQVHTCKKKGGFCALRWLLDTVLPDCDFQLEDGECKDYGCGCCIKCNRDKCSKCTQNGGNCRKACRADEERDYIDECEHLYCACCKKCEILDECVAANGTCRANKYDCPPGTAASTGCCAGCVCCKPELEPVAFGCERDGAYCALQEEDCNRPGYYACFGECEATQYYNGLTSPLVGYCCLPKIAPEGTGKRIEEFDDNMNEEAMENIESEQLHNLAPRPLSGDRAQGNVEEVVEDQIYNEVVPLQNQEELAINIEQSIVEIEVVEQTHDKGASPIQEDSDPDADIAIDEPINISDQVLDNPIVISNQVLDSPILEQLVDSDNQVDESNGGDDKPKHHRRHKKQNDEIINEVEEPKHHRRPKMQADESNDENENKNNHNRHHKN